MSSAPGTIAAFAEEEYERRRTTAQRKRDDGALTRDQAEALLRPWLALACRLGADIPELGPLLADWHAVGGDQPFFTEPQVRALVADDIASLDEIRVTLTEARARAMGWYDSPAPARRARATLIATLATTFAAPWPEEQAAA